MHRQATIFGLVIAVAIAGPARATTFCVGTADGLQHALTVASTNGQDNTIKVRAGTYATPDAGFTYDHESGSNVLDIEGGWNAGCTAQTKDASLTRLDGGDEHPLIFFFAFDPDTRGDIILRYFDMYDGISQDDWPPIYIETVAADIRIENSRIRYNFGLAPDTDIATLGSYGGGAVYFLDNVVAENTSRYSRDLLSLLSIDERVYFNNNTITANLFGTSSDEVDGLVSVSYGDGDLANNIVWANTAGYPEVYVAESLRLVDNDIDLIGATPGSGSSGNIAADPRFVGATNRHLRADSPACDAGDDDPPGTTRTLDLDGNARRVRRVDMGAYELQGACR
jgi:hypothetical protein